VNWGQINVFRRCPRKLSSSEPAYYLSICGIAEGHLARLPLGLDRFTKLNRDVNLMVLSGGLASLPYGYLMIIQAIYLKVIGIDEATIGLIFSVSTLTGALLTIPVGILSDRYSKKWISVIGGAVLAVAWLLYVVSVDVVAFYVASFLLGVGFSTFTASTALMAERTSEDERTVAYSLWSFAFMAGSTLGALASGIPDWIMQQMGVGPVLGYQPMFVAAFALCLMSSLALLPLKEGQGRPGGRTIFPSRSRKEIAKLATVSAAIGLGAGFIIPLLPLWFYLRFGVGGGDLGILTVIANALMAVSYLIAPELGRRLGPVGSIVSTQLLATGLLLIMPVSASYGIVAALYVFRAFLMNLSSPIQSAFAMSVVHPEERASAAAICSPFSGVAWGFPNAVSQGIGGSMLKQGMLELPFYVCGILYFLGAALFFVFFRGGRSRPRQG